MSPFQGRSVSTRRPWELTFSVEAASVRNGSAYARAALESSRDYGFLYGSHPWWANFARIGEIESVRPQRLQGQTPAHGSSHGSERCATDLLAGNSRRKGRVSPHIRISSGRSPHVLKFIQGRAALTRLEPPGLGSVGLEQRLSVGGRRIRGQTNKPAKSRRRLAWGQFAFAIL